MQPKETPLSDAFKRRPFLNRKITAKSAQKDITDTPLFGQQRRALEEAQEKAQRPLL